MRAAQLETTGCAPLVEKSSEMRGDDVALEMAVTRRGCNRFRRLENRLKAESDNDPITVPADKIATGGLGGGAFQRPLYKSTHSHGRINPDSRDVTRIEVGSWFRR